MTADKRLVRRITDRDQLEAHESEAREGGVEEYVEFYEVKTSGATLHVAVAGPEDGEPVVLLHGFPDFWLSWAWQVKPLSDAGYRLIMPDQRGYNRSSKPHDINAYLLPELGQDVLDLLTAFGCGEEPVHLVGHDWGGALSWWLAENHAERWATLTVLNCPPMKVLAKAAQKHLRQLRKSWYIVLFQLPLVPEKVLGARECEALVAVLKKAATPSAFTGAELKLYRKAWGQPGSIRGMVNWYRAGSRLLTKKSRREPITVPTTILWGEEDVALDALLIKPTAARCEDVVVKRFPGAGHWVHREVPEVIAAAMLESFQRSVEH